MADSSSDTAFIFVGVNARGGCPAMELAPCADVDQAIARARSWLTVHSTCVRVQVWRDDVLLADLLRD